jgi:hypothetical protein
MLSSTSAQTRAARSRTSRVGREGGKEGRRDGREGGKDGKRDGTEGRASNHYAHFPSFNPNRVRLQQNDVLKLQDLELLRMVCLPPPLPSSFPSSLVPASLVISLIYLPSSPVLNATSQPSPPPSLPHSLTPALP